jgi:hypothetical protein
MNDDPQSNPILAALPIIERLLRDDVVLVPVHDIESLIEDSDNGEWANVSDALRAMITAAQEEPQ